MRAGITMSLSGPSRVRARILESVVRDVLSSFLMFCFVCIVLASKEFIVFVRVWPKFQMLRTSLVPQKFTARDSIFTTVFTQVIVVFTCTCL